MSLTKDVHSLNKSLRRWCGLVAISEALELVLEVHGRSEKETAGRGIRENVTKLGKRLAKRFPKEGHVFLAARFELSSTKATNTIVISLSFGNLRFPRSLIFSNFFEVNFEVLRKSPNAHSSARVRSAHS